MCFGEGSNLGKVVFLAGCVLGRVVIWGRCFFGWVFFLGGGSILSMCFFLGIFVLSVLKIGLCSNTCLNDPSILRPPHLTINYFRTSFHRCLYIFQHNNETISIRTPTSFCGTNSSLNIKLYLYNTNHMLAI